MKEAESFGEIISTQLLPKSKLLNITYCNPNEAANALISLAKHA